MSPAFLSREPGILVALIAIPGLVYYGNPAIALMVATVAAVVLNRSLLPGASTYGKYALQTAIVLLGLRLDAGFLLELSEGFALVIGVYVVLTLALGLVLGKLIRSEPASSKLISAGTAICGGTAIASLSPIVHARSEQTGMAMALVFLLNAVALLTFPLIGEYLGLTQSQFGIWVSMAIHDTSSVVATAAIYGDEAASVATTLKLGRTLWLIPLMLLFSLYEKAPQAKLRIPGFILLFVAASLVSSTLTLPTLVPEVAGVVSKALLVVALFFIGSDITRETLKRLRGTVLLQGLALWALVVPLTLLVSLQFA